MKEIGHLIDHFNGKNHPFHITSGVGCGPQPLSFQLDYCFLSSFGRVSFPLSHVPTVEQFQAALDIVYSPKRDDPSVIQWMPNTIYNVGGLEFHIIR